MKRVLVSLSANSVASREFLMGVFNYVNAGHDWRINFQQNPNDLTPQLLKSFARDGLDGIVTGINRATPGYRTMISLGIPLALNNFPAELPPPDNPNIAVLRNDELAIGRAAAKLLRSKGSFRTYAFMPPEERAYWSVLRERGFRLELGKSKIIPIKFRMSETQLGAWLKSLPRPAAIFPEFATLILRKGVSGQWRRGFGTCRPHNNLGIHFRTGLPSPSARGFRLGCRAAA